MKTNHMIASCNARLVKQHLPRHVKIGPHVYSVEITKDLRNEAGEPCDCRVDYVTQTIHLNPNHIDADSEFLDSFLHGVVEIADETFGLGLDTEEDVSRLAGVLTMLIVDNFPLVRARHPMDESKVDPEADPLFTVVGHGVDGDEYRTAPVEGDSG